MQVQLSRDYELLLEIERRAISMILQRALKNLTDSEEFERLVKIYELASTARKLLLCVEEAIYEHYDPEKRAVFIPHLGYIPVTSRECSAVARKIEEYLANIYEKIKEIATTGKN